MAYQLSVKDVSEPTRKNVIMLNLLRITEKTNYATIGQIRDVLLWKGGYVAEPLHEGGRETIRTWLRLFTNDWNNPEDKSFGDVPMNLCLLREALLQSDGFYGAGINWVRHQLGFSSPEELAAKMRAHSLGDAKPISQVPGSPLIQHYVYDPIRCCSLAIEISRRDNGTPFGLFWYMGENKDSIFIEDIRRVFSVSTPTIQHEPALVVSSAPGEFAWLV